MRGGTAGVWADMDNITGSTGRTGGKSAVGAHLSHIYRMNMRTFVTIFMAIIGSDKISVHQSNPLCVCVSSGKFR